MNLIILGGLISLVPSPQVLLLVTLNYLAFSMLGYKPRLALLLVLLACTSIAQQIVPRFETLSVDQGLSQNSVYRIYQDRKGFMWFATGDGLNRYDGKAIRVFKVEERSPAVANVNTVRGSLCEDYSNRIWYANETGIYFFNPLKEKVEMAYDLVDSTPGSVYYLGVLLDGDSDFWILSPSQGVARFSTRDKHLALFALPDDIKPGEYATFPEAAFPYLFFHVPSRPGALRFDVRTHTYDWIFQDLGKIVLRPYKKFLFLIGERTLWKYDSLAGTVTRTPVLSEGTLRDAFQDSFGRTWVGSASNGLFALSPEGKTIAYHNDFSKPNSLPSELITDLFDDVNRNLWIGTDGGGVARLDLKAQRFNRFPVASEDYPGLKEYFIRCLSEGEDGQVWFGTHLNGLVRFDLKLARITKYMNKAGDETSLPVNSVTSLLRDKDKRLWVGHTMGVSLLDESNHSFTHVAMRPNYFESVGPNPVFQIAQLRSGDMIAATFHGVYHILAGGGAGQKHVGMLIDKLPANPTGVHESSDGSIWVTSAMGGLTRRREGVEPDSQVESFFPKTDIRSLHPDEREPEVLWLSSGSGLIRFDTRTGEHQLIRGHGMPGTGVYGVLEDSNHNFWMSANAGLYFFDRTRDSIRVFTAKDGLQSNEFNAGAFHKGPSGTMYFGGIKGINWFQAGAENSNENPPRCAVTSIIVNDRKVTNDSLLFYTRSISLSHDQSDVSFEVAVLDYSRTEANKIQYRLEGWEEDWVTSDHPSIRYSNLAPGNYVFRVKATNRGRIWGAEERVYIRIGAPFWKTNWFLGGVGLIALGAVIGITRLVAQRKLSRRLREVEKLQAVWEERERISKDIHDDLGTGLSRISIISELARQSNGTNDFTQRQLEKISESSRELIDNLGELIWSHNPSNDSLKKLLWYVREHLSALFDGTNIHLEIAIPELANDLVVPAPWRRSIFLAVKESLHNVLKHSGAHEATLSFTILQNHIVVEIIDDGKGFDPAARSISGHGLANIRKRVEDCHGMVTIESRPGRTSLLLDVPLAS